MFSKVTIAILLTLAIRRASALFIFVDGVEGSVDAGSKLVRKTREMHLNSFDKMSGNINNLFSVIYYSAIS